MRNLLIIVAAFLLLASCQRDKQVVKESLNLDLENAVIQQIFNFQNKRSTQNLLPFLSVDNPSHRYMAAMAFASVQDTSVIAELADLLRDDYPEVRVAAAYALGQTKHPGATKYLAEAFAQDSSRMVQAAILEAVGRCGNLNALKYMATTPPYPIQDSILWEGQALGIYRFGLRGLLHKEGTTKIMNDFIANSLMAPKARFIAANYLARNNKIDLTGYENVLINNVQEETDPNTLMYLVLGLAKSKTKRAMKTLMEMYPKQKDYRVRCNILKGFKFFEYDSVKAVAFEALKDSNINVQITAAEYLHYSGNDFDCNVYFELGQSHDSWQVRALLLGACLRNSMYFKTKTKNFFTSRIVAIYQKSENLYEKAALLKALGNYSWNYRFLELAMFSRVDSIKIPEVIRSSATEALVTLRTSKDFARELAISTTRVISDIDIIFKRVLKEGDPAMIAIVSEFLTRPELKYKGKFTDIKLLKDAQAKLSLPSEIETHIYLQKAINYLSDNEEDKPNVKSGKAVDIDWQILRALKDNNQILIRTSKGNITLHLLPSAAPATVTQFVLLVKAGYYNGKVFHRVVPNFVVQGGCSRGDGWSGFQETVMSEFNKDFKYHQEGMVGMASAGKDTESAQFFITHSPTPHLDGNYTIFAKVASGMDVVHKLEVGDVIERIEIN